MILYLLKPFQTFCENVKDYQTPAIPDNMHTITM